MEFEWINKTYGVNACIGRRVIVDGEAGVITKDCGNYIGVVFDGMKASQVTNCHPTWEVVYLDMGKIPKMTRSQKRYREYLDKELDCSFAEYMGFKKR